MRSDGTVYGLCEPDTGELRYVGKSVVSPEGRLRSHVNRARRGLDDHKSAWIRMLIDYGLEPELVILEDGVSEDELNERECTWIAAMKRAGCRLTNITGGGDGGATRIGRKNTSTAWQRAHEHRMKTNNPSRGSKPCGPNCVCGRHRAQTPEEKARRGKSISSAYARKRNG
jgi:hypothetical protein